MNIDTYILERMKQNINKLGIEGALEAIERIKRAEYRYKMKEYFLKVVAVDL